MLQSLIPIIKRIQPDIINILLVRDSYAGFYKQIVVHDKYLMTLKQSDYSLFYTHDVQNALCDYITYGNSDINIHLQHLWHSVYSKSFSINIQPCSSIYYTRSYITVHKADSKWEEIGNEAEMIKQLSYLIKELL